MDAQQVNEFLDEYKATVDEIVAGHEPDLNDVLDSYRKLYPEAVTRVRVELTTTVKEGWRVGGLTAEVTIPGLPTPGAIRILERAYLQAARNAGEIEAAIANAKAVAS